MPSSGPETGPALLYLVYGDNPVYQQELSYSVLSALRESRGPLRILLFSDAANQRSDLPVTPYVISEAERHDWTFGGRYHHALKLFVLRRALQIAGGKVCFVDTDTAFRADPAQVFDRITEDTVVMHADEGPLAGLHSWNALLPKAARAGLGEVVHPQARMYNSGLIGVMPGAAEVLADAAALARDLHALEPVFNIEQFVLGAMLGRDRSIRLANDIVDHYWGYRRYIYHGEIPDALARLEGTYTQQTARALPVVTDPPKPLMARLRARLHGKLYGADANYRFAHLACLASATAQSPKYRRIWADIALDMLKRSATRARQRQDFRRFSPEALQTSGLDERRQKAWMAFWLDG